MVCMLALSPSLHRCLPGTNWLISYQAEPAFYFILRFRLQEIDHDP